MNASLDEKLRTVKWGEYKLGDLFKSSNGDYDIQKEHINGLGEYVITSGLSNNGILGKTDVAAKVFQAGTITVDMFGASFYRNFRYKMVTHARVFSLTPKSFILNDKKGLFISSALRYICHIFGFDNMCTWDKIKEKSIKLPTRTGKIDFDFMESFIAELEAERVAELSAYLTVSGLDNYELSSDEEKAIEQLKAQQIPFAEFDILRVFDVKNTHNILSDDIVSGSGNVPYLGAGADNNSVSSYISYNNDYLEKGNCIFIGGKTFTVTYQEQDFFSNDSHNLALYEKEIVADKLQQLYIATCVKSSLSHKYTWGDSVSKAKIKTDKINLPTKDGKPDYDSMATLISAVQKMVIKDVVKYTDEKTKAYHTVVGHNDKQKIEYTYEIKLKPLMVADGDRADETSLFID